MRRRASVLTGVVLFTAWAIIIPASQAQSSPQARRRAPIQRRYYERTDTRPTTALAAREPVRARAAFRDRDAEEEADAREEPETLRALGPTDHREGFGEPRESEEDDLLSHYESRGRSHALRPGRGSGSLGNFTPAPVRARPTPQIRHNYFPDMPSGRHARHRCVPGRGQLLGRRL